jgi:hypothetical protein
MSVAGRQPPILPILGGSLALVALAGALHAAGGEFRRGRSSFTVTIGDETIEYDTLAVSCMPGETLKLQIPMARPGEPFSLLSEGARPVRVAETRSWQWRAPDQPGMREIHVVRESTGEAMVIRVFVLTPATEIAGGKLHGYTIGSYPDKPLRGLPAYRAPRGFVEVTRENQDQPVSPHFRLRQFLCKQAGGFPKYVLVDTRLLRALEGLLETLNAAGFRADTLFVMSGFRTPTYNAALGDTPYSRHQWGDAADAYPDHDGDGLIDDLDGNGKSDSRDADFLYTFIESLSGEKVFSPYTGGLGRYGSTRSHPPFVHIDTRGYRARWRE